MVSDSMKVESALSPRLPCKGLSVTLYQRDACGMTAASESVIPSMTLIGRLVYHNLCFCKVLWTPICVDGTCLLMILLLILFLLILFLLIPLQIMDILPIIVSRCPITVYCSYYVILQQWNNGPIAHITREVAR